MICAFIPESANVPAIVRWPGVVPAGRVTNQVALTMDWYRRQANGEDALALCLEEIEGYEARP